MRLQLSAGAQSSESSTMVEDVSKMACSHIAIGRKPQFLVWSSPGS